MPLIRLRKRPWLLVVLATLIVLLAAFVYLHLATPIYRSTARILVERHGPPVPPDFPLNRLDFPLKQVKIIMSRPVVKEALNDPNVLTRAASPDPNYLNDLAATLTASVEKNTALIRVSAAAPHPQDAADFVNAVVGAYIQQHEDPSQSFRVEWLKSLTDELDERRRQLTVTRQALVQLELQRDYPHLLSEQPPRSDKALAQLGQQLFKARLVTIEATCHYQQLKRYETDTARFRAYVEANRDRRPPTTAAEAKTDDTVTEPNTDFVRKHLALAKTRLQQAREQQAMVEQRYTQALEKVRDNRTVEAQYRFHLSECQSLQEMCNALIQRIREVEITPLSPALRIHILENAVPATKSARPTLDVSRLLTPAVVAALLVMAFLAAMAPPPTPGQKDGAM